VPGTIRTFVALDLPESHRQALAAHLLGCAEVAPAYGWVQPDSLHLTLRFLGHLEPALLERVRGELATLREPPFRLALDSRGTFGPRAAPRVVWLGVSEGLDTCARLARVVDAACHEAGVEADARAFRAHVTLGRARSEGDRLGKLPEPPQLSPWTVADFVLYESRLRRQPRYVPLERYPLRLRKTTCPA
jgi:2'-5' RNA ligase